ncbi:MAG TPA: GvpL/GvpF family gas vesicle protein, partial [Thermoanaerobaculia bacterium]
MSRTYVYCVVRGDGEPALAGAPAGVPGAGPLRALPAADDLWLVVADVPRADYDADAISCGLDDLAWVSERALGHERVVEHLADPAGERGAPRAVLPLKLFTLFDSDERARRWAAGEAPRLAARLDRLAGRVEIGVRVRWLAPPAGSGAAAERPASGTDFLRAKQRRRDERRERAAAAVRAAALAFDELTATAEDARRRPPPAEAAALLLDAVFLVAAGAGVAAFEERADAVARRLADAGCELTVTG